MTANSYLERVRHNVATTGQGTITLSGSAFSAAFQTMAQAGAVDGATYPYVLLEGNDFEEGTGVYTASGTTFTRNIRQSLIGGTPSTSTKMTLLGNAVFAIDVGAEDFANFVTLADAQALTNKTINASSNTISNLATSMFAANVIDTDGALTANSDTRLATQKAVKTYADQLIASQDAMVFKGVIDCSTNPNYPAADRGATYRVSVAGLIGGASGVHVEVGDILICLTDGTAGGNQATVGSAWTAIETNIDGALVSGGALGTPSSGNASNLTNFPTLNQNTSGSAATLTTSRNIDGQAFNGSADITVIAPGTHAATSKTTPVDADELPIVDSAASNVLKKLTWANLKTALSALFVNFGVTGIFTVGYTVTPLAKGNITSFTLDPTLGNLQWGINHAAFTLTAPTADCNVSLGIVNDATAGAITFSGFSAGGNTGDPYVTTAQTTATVTVTAATDIVNHSAHGLVDKWPVWMTAATTMPGGLTSGTIYYVIFVSSGTYKLSATPGGSAIDITSTGSGTLTIHVCTVFQLIVQRIAGLATYAWKALQ